MMSKSRPLPGQPDHPVGQDQKEEPQDRLQEKNREAKKQWACHLHSSTGSPRVNIVPVLCPGFCGQDGDMGAAAARQCHPALPGGLRQSVSVFI